MTPTGLEQLDANRVTHSSSIVSSRCNSSSTLLSREKSVRGPADMPVP